MGASWADHKSKILSFWSIVLSYSTQQWTISQSDCDVWWKVDFIQQLAMTNSVVGPRISAKHFPKPNLLPKKVMGYCLVVCCQSDPLELFESQRNHYIWEVCSTNQWDERAQFFSTIMPMSHNQHFKGRTNWAMNFCLICHIQVTTHQPTTTSSRILTTFCRENASTTSRRQKMYEFLCYRSKQIYFSLAKLCWL